MPRLGVLRAAALPDVPSLGALGAALSDGNDTDLRFVHAPAYDLPQNPGGLIRGGNLFGPGRSPLMTDSPTGIGKVREATSVLLHEALFVPGSMTVVDRHGRLFQDGIDNLGSPAKLAEWGAPYALDPEAALCLSDGCREDAPHDDRIALPICGVGLPNYGHFLFDGLPLVLLHALSLPAALAWCIVGQELTTWQAEILDALELRARYVAVMRPTVFRRVLASTLLALHVSYPGQFVRPLFDLLRFRHGGPAADAPGRVFLSRGGHDGVRVLRNRAAVEAALQLQGFAIVQPNTLSFSEQIAIMAGARLVVGEAGAGMANVGFCRPGTKVIEIQPECFPDAWIRGACLQLGHRWHLYLAGVDDIGAADGRRPLRFSYEIDPLDLMAAVARVGAAP